MARARKASSSPVSAGNPCPFLRALVAQGLLADGVEPLGKVTSTIVAVARAGEGRPALPAAAIWAIALIAHGLSPLTMARTKREGLRLSGLRDGPLDKHGAGSGILDANGRVVARELARLDEFASEQIGRSGQSERGLTLAQIRRYMDANFERAEGRRRALDRKLMDGEWPVLLKVMGRDGSGGRYLSVADVRTLVVDRALPKRMTQALATTA
jgi:hypothetical protein